MIALLCAITVAGVILASCSDPLHGVLVRSCPNGERVYQDAGRRLYTVEARSDFSPQRLAPSVTPDAYCATATRKR